jgi:hypothetical protein
VDPGRSRTAIAWTRNNNFLLMDSSPTSKSWWWRRWCGYNGTRSSFRRTRWWRNWSSWYWSTGTGPWKQLILVEVVDQVANILKWRFRNSNYKV